MPADSTSTLHKLLSTPFSFADWLKDLGSVATVIALILYGVYLIIREPAKTFMQSLFDQLALRMKTPSKQPATELGGKARKGMMLDQITLRLRLDSGCDHVELYAIQNGEYLRTSEGIEKFFMVSEAPQPGDPYYMDTERILYASDIKALVAVLDTGQPYVLLWHSKCDDWKANKLMSDRDYNSSIYAFVRRGATKANPAGVIGMFSLNWRRAEIYRPDQVPLPTHDGPVRLLDAELEQLVHEYALEFSYAM